MKKYPSIIAALVSLLIIPLSLEREDQQEAFDEASIKEIKVELGGQTYQLEGIVVCMEEDDCTVSEKERSMEKLKDQVDIPEYKVERGTEIELSFSTKEPHRLSYTEREGSKVTVETIGGMSFEVYGLDGADKLYQIEALWQNDNQRRTLVYYPIRLTVM